MVARFSSRCPGCGGRIAKGSNITKAGRRYVCADCADCAGNGRTAYEQGDRSEGARRSHYDRTGTYSHDGTFMGRRNPRGRCEDAPCCGCCT